MPPTVSVIVPCYKVTPYVSDALESLHSQTFRDFEAIVVNDGCPDTENLERVLAPYRGEIVYVKKRNGGVASARNAAIMRSSAPLVALLDPDDAWEPDYLAVHVQILEASEEVAAVYPNATFFGEPPLGTAGKTFMEYFPSKGAANFKSILLQQCHVFGGVTVRRQELVKVGLFDESLRSCEDFDMWLRLCAAGARFTYHTRPLVRYRIRNTSLSHDTLALNAGRLRVLTKLAACPGLSAEDRDALEAALERQRVTVDLFLGKAALYAKNRDEALERLERCKRVMGGFKLDLAVLGLRYAPSLVYRYVRYRYGTQASFLG